MQVIQAIKRFSYGIEGFPRWAAFVVCRHIPGGYLAVPAGLVLQDGTWPGVDDVRAVFVPIKAVRDLGHMNEVGQLQGIEHA